MSERQCDRCFGPTLKHGGKDICSNDQCFYHLRPLPDCASTRRCGVCSGPVNSSNFMSFCDDEKCSQYLVPLPKKAASNVSGLPTEHHARKALPIFDGVVMYFPDAMAAISEVSVTGNEQHSPGEPLHWARGKSMDQFNTALRHMIDHRRGNVFDIEKSGTRTRHLAKAAWRVLAALQLSIEEENDTRKQNQSDDRQATEAVQSVLSQTSPERDGEPRARLPRKPQRVRVHNRSKGSRKRTD